MKPVLSFKKYQEGLEQGKFLGVLCEDCNTITTPPQAVCSSCSSRKLSVSEVEKEGTIKTFTVIRVASEGMNPPFVVAIVETNDGPYVMGNLINVDPDSVGMEIIGKKVKIDNQIVKGDRFAIGDIRSLTFKFE